MNRLILVKTRTALLSVRIVLGFSLLPFVSFAQANNFCANALPIVSSTSCSSTGNNVSGSLTNATTFTNIADDCGTSRHDVWFIFTAKSTNPTITISSSPPSNTRFQVYTAASCGGTVTSMGCVSSTSGSVSGLTIGVSYLIRVYSNNDSQGTFDICVVDPAPANDNCTGTPITLTSNTSCINTTGNFYGSTASSTTLGPCGTTSTFDVWYKFVAQDFTSTINISNLGSSVSGSGIGLQLIDNCGTPVTYACGSTSMTATNLTIGTTYYIRVYATSGVAPTTPTNAGFDICVTHPVPPVPPNDECSGAVTLQNNATCSNIYGSVLNATASAVPAGCAGTVTYDVWYKFVAAVTNPTVAISNPGANFTSRGIQLYSGNCGALSSISCNASSITASGLTIGNTYYVRVYSTSGTAPTGNGFFQICVSSPSLAPKFGNTYVNVTKKTSGGVVEPNDILEIRMTINHTNGTLYSMRYLDSVPTHTQMQISPAGNIQVLTNEGAVLPGKSFTTAPGDDAATYIANPPVGNYQIRMNLAFGATTVAFPPNNSTTETASATGRMVAASDIPKATTNTMLFATAFRVKVTGVVGDTITLGMGKFIYKAASGGPDIVLTATPYKILITQPMSLCANATGVNMSQEFGGTFGTGITQNRPTDLTSVIPGYTFVNTSSLQSLGDGQYSIVKNMSPRGGTNRLAEKIPSGCPTALPSQNACAQRMHGGHWDIDGDHSGTSDAIGNIPLAEGANGGYMLMVNADYVASETYRQTINNLCPNTYYEFSAWIRNICPTCGNDYTTGNNYSPTRTPGVLPNLTFSLDGLDHYNTGEIAYGNGWVKKGFVFVTGPSQNSATFSIRNNSQGGGGNDWAMDDISVATCLPNMNYSPSLSPTVCEANTLTIHDTIRSYFNNYRHHQWQRSIDNGLHWADVSTLRDSVPTFNVALNSWQYVTSYTIPPGNTSVSDSGDLYRVIVATTASNVGNTSCQVTDGISIINLSVINCAPVLSTNILTFNAILVDDKARLNWTTSREEKQVRFTIERSLDGSNFIAAGSVEGFNNGISSTNYYSFADPFAITGKVFYRIVMTDQDNRKRYSRIIQLNKQGVAAFGFVNVINPFNQSLEFDINSPSDRKAEAEILDMFGKVVKKSSYLVHKGINTLSIFDTGYLPAGAYVFRVKCNDEVISKKVLKKNAL